MPAMQETQVQSLVLKITWTSPIEGNGNPLQYSCLTNPIDRGAWQAIVQGGSQKVRRGLATKTTTYGVIIDNEK